MSAFVDYVLTLGQKSVPNGYASLGLSLEQYGVNAVKQFVPGAVATTAAEQTAYACGDLTPAEVANNQTTVTCGVQQATVTATASSGTAKGGGTPTTPGSTAANGSHSAASTGTGAPTSFVSGSGPLGGVDPFISLSGPLGGLPNTGADVLPLTALGTSLLLLGWIGRRRFGQRSEWVAHTSWEERGVK
jgi:LPXTG-motif cell wall-anchored protein